MTWTIVLSGGEGDPLTEEARRLGAAVPKRFRDFDGRGTLLDLALERAARFSPPERVLVVTQRAHRDDVDEVLSRHPGVSRLEQPRGRGSAPAVAMGVLAVYSRDRDAEVLILPGDHHVGDEDALASAVRRGFDAVRGSDRSIAVLGAPPEGPVEGYGWLVPGVDASVDAFIERPDPAVLSSLRSRGALVSTMVMVGQARAFTSALAYCAPAWTRSLMWAGGDEVRLSDAFDALPESNFSRDVLQRVPQMLRLVEVPRAAGWADVGTPTRLARALSMHGLVVSK